MLPKHDITYFNATEIFIQPLSDTQNSSKTEEKDSQSYLKKDNKFIPRLEEERIISFTL